MAGLIYDHAAADFFLTVSREWQGLQVVAANKRRVEGIERVNSYLKAGALLIPAVRPRGVGWWEKAEIEKLHEELRTVRSPDGGRTKGGSTDDLTDCLRYLCMKVDLDLALVDAPGTKTGRPKLVRRGRHVWEEGEDDAAGVDREVVYWDSLQDAWGRV